MTGALGQIGPTPLRIAPKQAQLHNAKGRPKGAFLLDKARPFISAGAGYFLGHKSVNIGVCKYFQRLKIFATLHLRIKSIHANVAMRPDRGHGCRRCQLEPERPSE